MLLYFVPTSNREYLTRVVNSFIAYPFRAYYIYTDIFFMLSGFLLSYSMLGKLQKGIKINYWKEIFGRYLRMMPPLAAVIMFSSFILPYIASGPMWNIVTVEADVCKANGWRNFLMIHNWYGMDKMCLPHTHHIATEFSLYVVSLFLIVVLHKHPKKGAALIVALAIISSILRFIIVYEKGAVIFVHHGVELVLPRSCPRICAINICLFFLRIHKLMTSVNSMYLLPHYRFSDYAVGILLGLILRNSKNFRLSKLQTVVGEILSAACLLVTVFLLTSNDKFDRLYQALYASIASATFCFFFSWFIVAPQFGYKSKKC